MLIGLVCFRPWVLSVWRSCKGAPRRRWRKLSRNPSKVKLCGTNLNEQQERSDWTKPQTVSQPDQWRPSVGCKVIIYLRKILPPPSWRLALLSWVTFVARCFLRGVSNVLHRTYVKRRTLKKRLHSMSRNFVLVTSQNHSCDGFLQVHYTIFVILLSFEGIEFKRNTVIFQKRWTWDWTVVCWERFPFCSFSFLNLIEFNWEFRSLDDQY